MTRRYQAIGTVEGVLDLDGERSTLRMGEFVFQAKVAAKAVPHVHAGETQFLRVYPNFTADQALIFKVIGVTVPPATPLILQGCWELDNGLPRMVIYRNERHIYSESKSRNALSVAWENAPAPDGKFWELEAEVRDGNLVIVSEQGPFEPPPKVEIVQPRAPQPQVSKAFVRPSKRPSV